MRVLCVAEKPSIAKELARILSHGHYDNRAGVHKYCRNFDFPYRLPPPLGDNRDCQFTVTSVLGHLTETVSRTEAVPAQLGVRCQRGKVWSPGNRRSFIAIVPVRSNPTSDLPSPELKNADDQDFGDEFRQWSSCDPFALFDAPVQTRVTSNLRQLERNLQNEARNADILMIWTDCDREGEHIGYEVVEVCRIVNPRLRVRRARFSAIIDK